MWWSYQSALCWRGVPNKTADGRAFCLEPLCGQPTKNKKVVQVRYRFTTGEVSDIGSPKRKDGATESRK